MRVLLLHHFPLNSSPAGQLTRSLAQALGAAGHETRLLNVSDRPEGDPVRTIVCRAGDRSADLDFDLPYFAACHPGQEHQTFAALADRQLEAYRLRIRQTLDE